MKLKINLDLGKIEVNLYNAILTQKHIIEKMFGMLCVVKNELPEAVRSVSTHLNLTYL